MSETLEESKTHGWQDAVRDSLPAGTYTDGWQDAVKDFLDNEGDRDFLHDMMHICRDKYFETYNEFARGYWQSMKNCLYPY